MVVVLFVVGSVRGQNPDDIVIIPDANFKLLLLNTSEVSNVAKNLNGEFFAIDINNDEEIQFSEALQVGYLRLYSANIASLLGIEAFENLTTLDCSNNTITTLDVSNLVNLTSLNCAYNTITTLDVSNLVNLNTLNCRTNALVSLNVSGLTSMSGLSFDNNPITNIDLSSLTGLSNLICHSTLLTELDVSNSLLLSSIDCSFGVLTTLDLSNKPNLINVFCNNNYLLNLNLSNSINIDTLYCQNNQLVSLDVSDLVGLTWLRCGYNLLTSLDVSNSPEIEELNCRDNQLTTLNLMNQTTLNTFNCYQNQITTLFMKNGTTEQGSSLGNNPFQYICADEADINGVLSNYVNTCVINSYCSFTPGGVFYIINGTNVIDGNNNGCDASDESLPNLKFNITNGTQTGILISNQSGEYSIPVQAGTHTITPVLENPTYFNITPASVEVAFPATTSPFTQNFCITPNGLHPDLEVVILPTSPAIPGFDADYKIILKNKGNIQQSGSVSFAYDDAILDYIIANPLFTTQGTGSLTWDFTNLEPFETRKINLTLNVNSPMETPAVNADDVLNYTASITSEATDELPLDNTFSLPQIVVNSFDPNDKTCLEGTSITPDMIGKYVHYMIRFENTGTFAAQNIVVKDMIDTAKFDVSSLVALNGSHSYVTRITDNKVEFIFENINLPFDDANNDGYVVFKIKTLPTLVLGDSFSNSASIYFDYNFPIITDPAVTTFAVLGTEDFEFNNYFALYPNPTNGVLNITSKQAIALQSINIYNTLGQMVVSVPNAKGVSSVDVSSLSTGNYFIKAVSDKGTSNAKFIKQ